MNTQPQQPQKRPTSPRQIAASQANGAKSTGPTTPEGRAASAAAPKNLRHGMLAQTVILGCESRERFDALVQDLLHEHRPHTKSEQIFIHNMAVARWRHLRMLILQKTIFDREIAKTMTVITVPTPAPIAAAIAYTNINNESRILSDAIRHEAAFERQFSRALRELKALQKNRPQTVELYDSTLIDDTAEDAIFGNSLFEPNPINEQPEILPTESATTT